MGPTSLQEGVRLALDQLRVNKLRSGLTILGLVVGVATVMLMSAVVGGVRSSVLTEIEAAGPRNFIVSRYNMDSPFSGGDGEPPWADNPRVTPDEAEYLDSLDDVAYTVVDFDFQTTINVEGERISGVQGGADGARWDEFSTGTFVNGYNFTEQDVRAARPVVVLSKPLADRLFGTLDPVGRRVRLDGRMFTVVGVFELSGNIFANIVKNFLIVPYTAAIKHLNVSDRLLSVLIVTAPDASQEDAMDQVIAAMRGLRGLRPAERNDFEIIRQDELAKTFNNMTGVFFAVMIALSSVALMVGGVGVIAIMMIAVTERTREIGVRKALGATPREILFQFLVEAMTLTVIGASIGLALGGGGAALLAGLTPVPAQVPLSAILAAVSMAAVAGIVFGIWPAFRAARMDPVEALRHE